MKREELITNREYILTKLQLSILTLIAVHKEKHKLDNLQLADALGVPPRHVLQLLNANWDYKISALVNLALACNTVPVINFIDIKEFITNDAQECL